MLDIEPTGSPDGLEVGCGNKRDQSGLKGSGVSNREAARSVGKYHQSTVARLGLKCLLHKPLVMLRACQLDVSPEFRREVWKEVEIWELYQRPLKSWV